MTPPDCRIYIDTDLSDSELLVIIREAIFLPGNPADVRAELFKNEDYHTERRLQFPDGFVCFRFYADFFIQGDDPLRASLIGGLLEALWAQGISAVAGCGFEHLLPEHGGYRSRNIPWARA
jgi:hypothetical protein